MINLPDPGLYRTTNGYPGHEVEIPPKALVYVGRNTETGVTFVVRPGQNRLNRWYWGEPTIPLRSTTWGSTLVSLPPEGFYTLPETLTSADGGSWLKGAIVQLGYNREGEGIVFVGERHDAEVRNLLLFSESGWKISDDLLFKLVWAPILPVRNPAEGSAGS